MLSKDDYKSFVKENAPKSPMWRSLAAAFFVGGIICCIGEGVSDAIKAIFPDMTTEDVGAWTTVIMIFLGSLLTGLGVYDKLGHFAGGGSIIPITGFANSVVSPAMEYNREGVFFGVCAKMFVIAGPIIVFGIVFSVVVGIIGLIAGL
ncbi:MAG: stage V sporulation protein AC [Acutalibacteraceae bacterium]